jgi:branched-chain amino acid transport system permease protein
MLDVIPQLLMNSLITGSSYALASAGLALSFGVLRILNFAHGHLMMLGAYIFLFFYARMNLPLLVAGIGTAVTMTVVALACLRVFVTPFAKINPLLPLITTIALGSMLEALVSIFFGVNVQSLTKGSFHDSMEFGGVYFTVIQLVIIGSAMVVFPLLGILIHVSPLGRAVAAITESREIATALGMRDKWIVRGVFVLGVLLASYAGVLIGFETNLQPTMGNSYSVKAFAAIILGGLGSVGGAVAGSFLLGIIENFSIGMDFWGISLPAGYKDAFGFLSILIVLLLRPSGLFGSKARRI